ncbi:MAG: hypothetical protein KIT87_19990 [Anaerolineae bacterium]|nr:hypothetical protein [Anaerolineae bacterium]
MRAPLNPGTVTWAGDHLLLALRPPQASEDTTFISLYRTLYSPVGVGYSLLVLSDVAADGWGADDVRAIYTDNPALTEWVRVYLTRRPNHPFRDPTLPVHAARFESDGAVGQTLQYRVHTPETDLEFTWADFETPFYLEAPQGVIGADYDIFSLICPARTGQVRIGGRAAAGVPYPNEVWRKSSGQPRSSALAALCEVLVDLTSR